MLTPPSTTTPRKAKYFHRASRTLVQLDLVQPAGLHELDLRDRLDEHIDDFRDESRRQEERSACVLKM